MANKKNAGFYRLIRKMLRVWGYIVRNPLAKGISADLMQGNGGRQPGIVPDPVSVMLNKFLPAANHHPGPPVVI